GRGKAHAVHRAAAPTTNTVRTPPARLDRATRGHRRETGAGCRAWTGVPESGIRPGRGARDVVPARPARGLPDTPTPGAARRDKPRRPLAAEGQAREAADLR
ncbi:MAG: hypothetical protein ACK559_30025, partial [bacterium]